MTRYILKRLLWMIFVAAGTAVVIFTILYLIPGDIVTSQLGVEATEEEKWLMRETLGLNDPYIVQLGRFLFNAFFRLDLGKSYIYGVPVIQELATRVPRTLILGVAAILLNSLVGIPLGMMAALHQNKWQDTLCMILALLFMSLPNFWVALQLVNLFSVKLNWLPAYGIDAGWKSYIMPIFAASMTGIASNARQTRSSMLEVIRADYITTARAKGVPEKRVILKHMMPNAMLPVITSLGVGLGKSIAGSVVIESVFSFPGVGLYLLTGITSKDYAIVRGSVIVLALFTAIVMLLVDILYALIDPRIKAQYSRG